MKPNIETTMDIFGNIIVQEKDCPLGRFECSTVTFSCEYFEGCNGSGSMGRCKKLLENNN